jgi:hypothetical protein
MPFIFGAPLLPDEYSPIIGPGQSRPLAGEKTREFTVMVHKAGYRPMKWITQAPNQKAALLYATNRWPGTQVEILK